MLLHALAWQATSIVMSETTLSAESDPGLLEEESPAETNEVSRTQKA